VKEKDVHFRYDDHQIVYIVEKEDGTYGPVQAGSYMFQTYGDDFREKLQYWAKQNLDDLSSGAVSPVGYHVQRLHMTAEDVGARTGIGVGKVKKHMTVAGFAGMTIAQAQRYAEVFGVPLAALFCVVAQPPKGPRVVLKPTRNPHAVIATVEENG